MEYRELPHGGEKFGVIGLGTVQLGATQSPFGQALILYQCLQYALDTPGVVCVVPGVRDRADLRVLLGFFDARDIGAYDTCPNGCRYCYANKDHRRAAENYRLHDPESPPLIGHLRPEDTVTQGVQKSLLGRPAHPRAVFTLS